MEIHPPLTGQSLLKLVNDPKPKRMPIIEGLLYEKSVLMISADPGCGKSVIALQLCMHLTSGTPAFSLFDIEKPYRIYFMQRERPQEEVLERLELMQKSIKWDPGKFVLDATTQGLTFTKDSQQLFLIRRIKECKPDLIVIDPLYAGHAGLSGEETTSSICMFLNKLQMETGASILINHHTTKTSYNYKGDKIQKDDPFYGSQFLKAFITGSYFVSSTDKGVSFKRTKDAHGNMISGFNLQFNHEDYTLSGMPNSLKARDRFVSLVNEKYAQKKGLTFNEIKEELGVSTPLIRRFLYTGTSDKVLRNVSKPGKTAYYEVVDKK